MPTVPTFASSPIILRFVAFLSACGLRATTPFRHYAFPRIPFPALLQTSFGFPRTILQTRCFRSGSGVPYIFLYTVSSLALHYPAVGRACRELSLLPSHTYGSPVNRFSTWITLDISNYCYRNRFIPAGNTCTLPAAGLFRVILTRSSILLNDATGLGFVYTFLLYACVPWFADTARIWRAAACF